MAGLGLGTMALVSSKVRTFQEGYQLGGAVVLPILLLVVGQVTGVLLLQPPGGGASEAVSFDSGLSAFVVRDEKFPPRGAPFPLGMICFSG